MSRKKKGFTIIELLVVIAIIGVLAGMLLPALGGARKEAQLAKCKSNLRGIGQAMALYMSRFGQYVSYPVPDENGFRGDAWLASLYWSGLLQNPELFHCPSTGDNGTLSASWPVNMNAVDAVAPDAVSYAGLCLNPAGANSAESMNGFTERHMKAASPMACDERDYTPGAAQNHDSGFSVVFFDTHVEFVEATDYDAIGTTGTVYEFMDSGD